MDADVRARLEASRKYCGDCPGVDCDRERALAGSCADLLAAIDELEAELRAAREVVEAAQANANTWDEYYHQRPVDRNLVSALAAYRAVVGEQG
jgi:hypothetical protein